MLPLTALRVRMPGMLHRVALTLLLLASVASAQQPTAGIVLFVEDQPRPTAERAGVKLFSALLERGPHAERIILSGRERANTRLAEAIRALASRHDVVDVVCSMHTIERDPAEWRRLLPPATVGRKLRLVYSTACFGARAEREAWEGVGARTVVTHVGINNPLVAEPYVLTEWLSGAPIGPTVDAAFRESTLFVRLGLSFPGVPLTPGDVPFLAGSRPVISGDRSLTVGRPARLPSALRYDRRRGGPLGLALRALAGRIAVRGRDAVQVLELCELPFPVAAELLQIEWLYVEQPGRLVIRLHAPQEVPLASHVKLLFDREVRLTPGAWDPVARRVELHVQGIRVAAGPVTLRPTTLAVDADPLLPGYRLRVHARVGFVPLRTSFYVGGTDPPGTRRGLVSLLPVFRR